MAAACSAAGLLSGVSLTGDRFFYPNPLASKAGYQRICQWLARFGFLVLDEVPAVSLGFQSDRFEELQPLLRPPPPTPKRQIGFHTK